MKEDKGQVTKHTSLLRFAMNAKRYVVFVSSLPDRTIEQRAFPIMPKAYFVSFVSLFPYRGIEQQAFSIAINANKQFMFIPGDSATSLQGSQWTGGLLALLLLTPESRCALTPWCRVLHAHTLGHCAMWCVTGGDGLVIVEEGEFQQPPQKAWADASLGRLQKKKKTAGKEMN